MDALENINNLMQQIKEATSNAASGAAGTDEKIALAKAAFRMAQQIQTSVDSSVFGGKQLLDGAFSANFIIGSNAANSLLTFSLDLTQNNNPDFNVDRAFNLNALNVANFGGVTGLDLAVLNDVKVENMGIFSDNQFETTLQSLSTAINNVNKVASYVGGIVNRLVSQEDLLKGQVANYNAAVSRIQDADVAKEQLELIKSQFLQQASLVSLTQANTNPKAFLQLIQG
jgi:flagellin